MRVTDGNLMHADRGDRPLDADGIDRPAIRRIPGDRVRRQCYGHVPGAGPHDRAGVYHRGHDAVPVVSGDKSASITSHVNRTLHESSGTVTIVAALALTVAYSNSGIVATHSSTSSFSDSTLTTTTVYGGRRTLP